MMNKTPFPEISKDFTIEDIHKIRDWNGERFATMTKEEITADINNGASEFLVVAENARRAKNADNLTAVV